MYILSAVPREVVHYISLRFSELLRPMEGDAFLVLLPGQRTLLGTAVGYRFHQNDSH